jgi:alpha-ribazole phosphatase
MTRDGELAALKSGVFPAVPLVYASPMLRAVQTAKIKFPSARIVLVRALREMDFGIFEGKSADDMALDRRYRAWVDGDCFGQCPGGEGRIEFSTRVCVAFSEIIGEALERRHRFVVIMAHSGTVMAIMDRFARPHRPYFDWQSQNCGGYRAYLDDATWAHAPILTEYERI